MTLAAPMHGRTLLGHLALLSSTMMGCGGPSPTQALQVPKAQSESPITDGTPEPLCKVLQPQFDKLTSKFDLGGKLECEDVPGAVTLGQFGEQARLDRNLLACVDDSAHLAQVVRVEPAALTGIEYQATATADARGVIGLGRIAPWLPDVKASRAKGERLNLKLTVTDATWETIGALTHVFEGQNHAFDCLPALCKEEAKVVYKILRGKVRVELHSAKEASISSDVTVLGGTAGFAVEKHEGVDSTVTLGSSEALVIGVVAKDCKTELTEARHCDGCGSRGQACCDSPNPCDESLSCIAGTCRPRGYPGGPCDEGRCSNAAACVRGVCRTGCGTSGLACCDKDGCADGQRCQFGQPARRDVSILDETVERTGGLFGTDVNLELGAASCGDGRLRSRFATTRVEGDSAHCDGAQWMAQSDPNDCRVRVHLHVSPFSKIRCRVQLFATELDPRVPAPQALCR